MWEIPDDEVETFEPLEGAKPWGVLQVHPSGKFAALEISTPGTEPRAGVWELSSGRLVWAPPEAQIISWNTAGSEVFAITKRSEEHTSELQSRLHLVCRLLLEKKKKKKNRRIY